VPTSPLALLTNRPGTRETLLLGVGLALLACLPFLVAVRPQMADYPSHLARYFVMLDGGRDPWLARYYAFDWRWTGNLGVDILIRPLAALIGLEPAGKLIAALIPPLTGLGLVCVEWVLRRRVGVGLMLALVTVWAPTLVMGMLNFSLAYALALFAFAGWVKLEGRRWRAPLFLAIAPLVWLCHIAGWGVLCVLVFGYELARQKSWRAMFSPWPLGLPFLLALLAGGPAVSSYYGPNVWIYKKAIWRTGLRDQVFALDHYGVLLLAACFILAAILRRIDWRLGLAALLFALLSLLVPRHLGGGDYSDYRLVAIALGIGALAISWQAPRLVLWLAPALYLARLAFTTLAWQADSAQLEVALKALDHVPQGARVASVVVEDRGRWSTDSMVHVGSYATIRRSALVNSHFAEPGVHMLHLREGGPEFKDPSQRILYTPGTPVDLASFAPARQADYLWFIGSRPPTGLPPGMTVIYRTPRSFLARLAKAPGPG